jgi:hypothetical protein
MEDAHRNPDQAGEPDETRYAAFLLRVWHNEASDAWRLLIEEVGVEARQGFTDWDELTRYLRSHVAKAHARDV